MEISLEVEIATILLSVHLLMQTRFGAKGKHREASDFYGSYKSGNQIINIVAN